MEPHGRPNSGRIMGWKRRSPQINEGLGLSDGTYEGSVRMSVYRQCRFFGGRDALVKRSDEDAAG
jgi:hypothetical protein